MYHLRRSIVACGILSMLGCGDGVESPETAPVTGTVMFQEKPVANANVSFHTDGAPRAAYAVTDSSGKFTLSMFGAKDGAMIGEHVVTVSIASETVASPTPSAPPSPEELAANQQKMMNSSKSQNESLLPEKYRSKTTTPLKFTVTAEGPNDFLLELTE